MIKLYGEVRILLLIIGISLLTNSLYAQNVGINGTGAAPDPKAMLDVASTTSGLLIPRMTQLERDAIVTPTTSLLIYQTDVTPGYYYYDGAAWVRFFSGAASNDWTLSGNAGIAAGNFIGSTNSADLNFRTNNVERMSIEANGDVIMDGTTFFVDESANRIGIGITTPQRQLHLHGSTTFNYLHITNSSTGSTTTDGMDVGVVSGEGRLLLRENADLAFYTNSIERMTIKNTGLVDITIKNNFGGSVTDMLNFNREADPAVPAAGIGTGITFGIEDAGGLEEQASIDVILDDVTNLSEDATITFNVNQGGTLSEIMRIDGSDGVVGIGTTTPSSTRKLQVFKNNNANKYVIHGDAHQTSITVDYQNVGIFGFSAGANATWGFATGLMGIGDQANSWRAIGVYAGLGPGPATIPSSDAALYSDAASLGYSGIFMNGNMGIGDLTPASMLTVGSGDLFQVNSSGNLVKINNVTYSWPAAQGAAGQVLQNNGSGTLTWASDAAGVTSVTASNGLTSSGGATPNITLGGALGAATTITQGANNMVFNLDGLGDFDIQDLGVSAFFVGDNGRVGIGDNVPFQQMEIKGGTTAWTLGGDDQGVDNLYLEDHSGADVDGGIGGSISFSGPGNGGSGARRHAAIAGVQETTETDYIGLAFYTHNNTVSTGNMQESVRISHDGKMGIGTTLPQGNLDVRGTANTKLIHTETTTGEIFFAGGNGGTVLMGGWSAGHSLGLTVANSEKMRILTDGKVGIGLTNPGELLHVNGNIAVADAVRFGTSGTLVPSIADDAAVDGSDWMTFRARGGFNFILDDDASNGINDEFQIWDDENVTGQILFNVEESGAVGIGTGGPNSRLHINAATGEHPFRIQISGSTKFFVGTNSNTALYFNDAPSNKLQLNVNDAAKPTSSSWTVSSDARLKTDIRPFTDGLGLIEKINPVWFKYNGEAGMPTNEQGVGTIAQELQKIAPYMITEWVYEEGSTDEENAHKIKAEDRIKTTYLGVDYGAMDFVIINAIKELKAENEALRARIEELEKANK